MTLVRGAAMILVLALVALGISWFTTVREQVPLPAGTSHSYAADGAQGLYLWLEAIGRRPTRLDSTSFAGGVASDVVFLVQLETQLNGEARAQLDSVLRRGGTIVAAGDSLPLRTYLPTLGVNLDAIQVEAQGRTTQGDVVAGPFRNRLRAEDGRVLLTSERGETLAIERAVRGGRLVVLSAAGPLMNAGLKDAATARWVLHEIVTPLPAQATVGFDEAHHNLPVAFQVAGPEFSAIVLESPAGRALVLAVGLVFAYLVLTGSGLGPALRPVESGAASRTMFEHVQAIAGLYRRSRQLRYLREHFLQHYRRVVGRAMGVGALDDVAAGSFSQRAYDPRAQTALEQIGSVLNDLAGARTEREIIDSVERMELALEGLPRAARGTLSSQ